MSYTDMTRDWLVGSVYQYGAVQSPYQYGYIIPIHDRKVIATANGYTAHYAWDIPSTSQEALYDHEHIQIVDFGFGQNIEVAKGWQTVIPAFTNLLNRFWVCESIRVDKISIIDALNHYDRFSEHGFEADSITSVQIRYSSSRLFMTCSEESTVFDFPVNALLKDKEVIVTVQGNYLKNALSGFEKDQSIVIRIVPNVLAIGTEGDKVAVIMGIVSGE